MKKQILLQILLPFTFANVLGASALADCPSTETIRQVAQREWGPTLLQRSTKALVDYRRCVDFRSCYESACAATPPPATSAEQFFTASRPFVMCSSATAEKGTVLLVHGFSDSPYTQGAIAETLSQAGYNVVTILLPGHGADSLERTSPMSLREWREAVKHGVNFARTLFPSKNLTLTGFSTGGMLVVDYMETHRNMGIKNVILFDPALALPELNERALTHNLSPINWGIRVFAKKTGKNDLGDLVNPARTPMRWVEDPAPIMSGIKEIRKRSGTISARTLVFLTSGHSDDGEDYTIDAERTGFALCGSPLNPGILRGQFKCESDTSLFHNQLPMREQYGQCASSEDRLVNPRFNEMMAKILDWIG